MTRLSVNINKIATLRNARGGNNPDLIQVAKDCERFGAEGITVHPRPDERHIRYNDVIKLKEIVTTEFNIEGNPQDKFMNLVLMVKPEQATLVPDGINAITSNAGWDTIKNESFLTQIITELKNNGIRSSIFVDPIPEIIEGAAKIGTDRIELYTEPYAAQYPSDKEQSIKSYVEAATLAHELGLEINAGHDLSLENLKYFKENIPNLAEVSIGHALICDAIYLGLENTIQLYKRQLI
ncbi:pyridoxine 5'-phosphate synthase [Chondrinema litorale]|uniref:pyridoxine 5'-phosphate synthase n=1 Tax=Chondrinema litorale TaxID=2994555 RepID=UPI002544A695|nr:pyridoxine 5'-phosphate synthase [Chondrinema litorale]UZR94687.1 pyridoxine 5'-phosphate synthase [Chondrinema litorale]